MVPLSVSLPLVAVAVAVEAASAFPPASSAHVICNFMNPSPGYPPPSLRRSMAPADTQDC